MKQQELNSKYRADRLSHDELLKLRQQVNNASDEQLAQGMAQVWDGNIDGSTVAPERVDIVKDRIDKTLRLQHQDKDGNAVNNGSLRTLKIYKWALRIAAVLVPLLVVNSVYLFSLYRSGSDNIVAFATSKGERASVVLPDGTKVSLNTNSRISYCPAEYNRKERTVSFTGEAYFIVAKNKSCPFVINNQNLRVKVLGTKFDLRTEQHSNISKLSLDEGSVDFTAVKTGKSEILFPGDIAKLDRSSGQITVSHSKSTVGMSSWMTKEMKFDNTDLSDVVGALEDCYDVRIIVSSTRQPDKFTGILPADNIAEVMKILQATYHAEIQWHGKQIEMVIK